MPSVNLINYMQNIYLIIGRSGSGKTTIVEELQRRYGLKSVESYTTRPKRCENETGHTFITKEEFDKKHMLAYTLFNSYEYGVDRELLDNSDLYVIDINGVKTLKENYKDKNIITINIRCSKNDLINNMRKRGDSEEMIKSRLKNDDKMFKEELTFPFDYIIKSDNNIENTLKKVYKIINKNVKD